MPETTAMPETMPGNGTDSMATTGADGSTDAPVTDEPMTTDKVGPEVTTMGGSASAVTASLLTLFLSLFVR